MMIDLVETLSKSDNKLLQAAANDMTKWSKLRHNKQDLELFLQFNLVHLRFFPRNSPNAKEIVCTSDTSFIKMFSELKSSMKKKMAKAKNNGIRTKDPNTVLTFNLLENKYNTVDLHDWQIINFLCITPENIELLDKMTNELLKRPIIDE